MQMEIQLITLIIICYVCVYLTGTNDDPFYCGNCLIIFIFIINIILVPIALT